MIFMKNCIKVNMIVILTCLIMCISCVILPVCAEEKTITVVDDLNREVTIQIPPSAVVSTGMATRFLSYLDALGPVIAVSSNDASNPESLSGAAYKLANPQLQNLPVVCEIASVNLNEELITSMSPDLIYKSDISDAKEADELSAKTRAPVVTIIKGGLGTEKDRNDLFRNLRLLGEISGKSDKAEDLIAYIETTIKDLNGRTKDIDDSAKPSVYVGGLAYKGSHGIESTSGTESALKFINANNVAYEMPSSGSVSKEQIIEWDPDVIFIDLATLGNAKTGKTAIQQLESDPSLKNLKALKNGRIYTTLPNVWSYSNMETPLANAYYMGSVLYPDAFADIDPKTKADEIYTKFLGTPLFAELNAQYDNLAYLNLNF